MKNIFVVIAFLFSTTALADSCLKRRGALDIGSGSTKAFAAVVDVCKKKIVQRLFDKKIPIPFGDSREKSATGEIPATVANDAAKKIAALVKSMNEKKLESVSAVATVAFRAASNGATVAADIGKQAKISVKILTQEEEADVGAQSALSEIEVDPQDRRQLVVWDIGGGSMQMWAKEQNKTEIYTGDLASVTFKNRIIKEVQNKDPKTTDSPNPIGSQSSKVVAMATEHASAQVPSFFKEKAAKARWIGIGGVLSLSLQNQVKEGANEFSQSGLEQTLKKRANLKDSQIEGEYESTEISNLALVLGYMKALKIEKIETVEASLVQGWLLSQP